MESNWKEEIRQYYCGNEMRELKKICDPIIYKKGIPQMYHDDLYSDAMKVLEESLASYDETKSSFHTYLTGNIRRSFYDWVRDSKRAKRCNFQRDGTGSVIRDENGKPIVISDISMEATTADGVNLSEKISDSHTVEDIIFSDENGISLGGRARAYVNSLSGVQKKIAKMVINGYEFPEIKEALNLSEKEFSCSLSLMRRYENRKHLYREPESVPIKEDDNIMGNLSYGTTSEKTKSVTYTVASIIKKLKKNVIRDNHPLQRSAGQWKPYAKSELISDTIQGDYIDPIHIHEEIVDGMKKLWLIDGIQRCTIWDEFIDDGFRISKNVQKPIVKYQTPKLDEEDKEMYDADGFALFEEREFDIRNKKFSQLPDEIQETIKDYNVQVALRMNCTKKDIAYDIARFNRTSGMNIFQSGWTGMDEGFAELVDKILKIDMFSVDCPNTSYTKACNINGSFRRMVVEAIMASHFIDDFNKDLRKMCEFLSENANDRVFTDFYVDMERLSSVLTDEIAPMFNMRDSFIWLAMFEKFIEIGAEDRRYIEFLSEFSKSLHSKKIDGVSYDDLCINRETGRARTTKDKSIVVQKMGLLERLLYDFLGVEMEKEVAIVGEEAGEVEEKEPAEENCEDGNDVSEEYITKFSDTDLMYGSNMSDSDIRSVAIDTLKMIDNNEEDALLYADCANEWLLEIKEDKGNIFTKSVLPAIIKFVKYIYDLDKPDSYGIKSLDKFLHSDITSDDVKQNYIGMVACAA